MKLSDRCRRVKFILSDVDGVLTDGGVVIDNVGVETKRFHIRDGLGIRLWQRAGMRFGILTARKSHVVEVRAKELGIDLVRQGFEAKWAAAEELLREVQVTADETAFIGDDLVDLPVIRRVGLGIAVADAAEEVRAAAGYVTRRAGGCGAVREVCELILKSQGRWDELMQTYYG